METAKQYEPFGEEWEAYLMTHTKKEIIDIFRISSKTRQPNSRIEECQRNDTDE